MANVTEADRSATPSLTAVPPVLLFVSSIGTVIPSMCRETAHPSPSLGISEPDSEAEERTTVFEVGLHGRVSGALLVVEGDDAIAGADGQRRSRNRPGQLVREPRGQT